MDSNKRIFEKNRQEERKKVQHEFDYVIYHEVGHMLVNLIHSNIPIMLITSPSNGFVQLFERGGWDTGVAGFVWEKLALSKDSVHVKADKEKNFYTSNANNPTDWDLLGNPSKAIVDTLCLTLENKCNKMFQFSHEVVKHIKRNRGFLVHADISKLNEEFQEQFHSEISDYMEWWCKYGNNLLGSLMMQEEILAIQKEAALATNKASYSTLEDVLGDYQQDVAGDTAKMI